MQFIKQKVGYGIFGNLGEKKEISQGVFVYYMGETSDFINPQDMQKLKDIFAWEKRSRELLKCFMF